MQLRFFLDIFFICPESTGKAQHFVSSVHLLLILGFNNVGTTQSACSSGRNETNLEEMQNWFSETFSTTF